GVAKLLQEPSVRAKFEARVGVQDTAGGRQPEQHLVVLDAADGDVTVVVAAGIALEGLVRAEADIPGREASHSFATSRSGSISAAMASVRSSSSEWFGGRGSFIAS